MPRDEAAYQREWRKGNTEGKQNSVRARHARDKAVRRLVSKFDKEFRDIHNEERREVGLPPVRD